MTAKVRIRASLQQSVSLTVDASHLASPQLLGNQRDAGNREVRCPLVREWLWNHYEKELLKAFTFEIDDEQEGAIFQQGEAKLDADNSSKSSLLLEQHPLDRCPFTGIKLSDCPPLPHTQAAPAITIIENALPTVILPPTLAAAEPNPNAATDTATMSYHSQMEMDLEKATVRLRLLDKIAQVQRQYLQMEDQKVVFGCLLAGLLELMDSEYGFIGEIKCEDPDDASTIYLQSHAVTNIAWDAATRAFYRDNIESGLRFSNLNTLFGAVMRTQEPVIANSPATDPRRGGIPRGHPPLKKFLGIPFFHKGQMNGMVGIANKPGGYSQADIDMLEPFVVTCSNLIQAYWQIQQNKHLINTLEEKVAARTLALEAANQRLAEANEKITKTSAAQLQHFACMSHEIRTPLNCIIGLSSLLQETELNPMQSESLKMVTSSSELLLTVVNDVLDYSKLESGNVDVTLRRSNLQEALIGVVHSIEMKTRGKNIVVKTLYDPYVPEYWNMDPLRLQQILFNLLGNAYKFSPSNDSIHLSVLLDKPESTELAGCHDLVLRFSVKDHGCGIKQENLQSIFQPFVQVGTDDTTLFEGTGLGLAITSKLVKAMGGAVYAKSEEGKWSEFHVEFPFVFTEHPELVAMDNVEKEGDPINQEQMTAETPVELTPNQPADVEGMSKRLSRNTILLVHSSAHDYEASESLPHIERIFEAYHVDFFVLKHMNELDEFQLGKVPPLTAPATGRPRLLDPSRRYICLINETQYEHKPMERLKSKVSTILLTFGPEFRVSETVGHFRNLLQVLPSVLMQSMIEADEEAAADSPPRKENPVSDTNAPCRTSGHDVNDLPGTSSQLRHQNMLKPANSRGNLRVRPRHEVSILVAEDNVINQKVLVALLKKVGFTKVKVVGDGQLAVNAVTQGHYDIVLMDVQMPVMNGLEATRIIVQRKREEMLKRQERKEEIGEPGGPHDEVDGVNGEVKNFTSSVGGPRIVFVTATVEQKLQEEAAALGAAGFVPKPFNLRQLEKCLMEICEALE